MNLNSTHFLTLQFCGPHTKPHGMIVLSKHYHLNLDPKLGQGICEYGG